MPVLRIIEPHGFCSGVKAAVEAAFKALAAPRPDGEKVYCLHELVHNAMVVDELVSRGMVFVQSLAEVPHGATVLFSAHGVSPAVREEAAARGLRTIDATCPFVMRVHREVRVYAARGIPVVIAGNASHDEVAGTAGEAPAGGVFIVDSPGDAAALPLPRDSEIGMVAQTTLGTGDVERIASALRAVFPRLRTTDAASVCYATRDRQKAVTDFVLSGGQGVIVLGSPASSNTRRLAETALAAGARFAVRAGTMEEVEALELPPLEVFGVTSGASTPEPFLVSAAARLREKIEKAV